MGTFALPPEKEQQVVTEVENTTNAGPITWRHWMLGPIMFLFLCGTYFQVNTGHQYIYRRVQEDIFPNESFTDGISYCAENKSHKDVQGLMLAQKKAAEYQLLFSVLSGGPAVFASIVLGSYTDKYGRKFLMIVSICGGLTNLLIFVVGSFLHMDLGLFGIAYACSGVVGGSYTFLLASFAFMADVTNHKNRAMGVLLIEICIGLGATASSLIAGYVIQGYGFFIPFVISACCVGVSLLMTIFLLPESFPKDKRISPKTKCAQFLRSFEFYYASWNRGYRWKYIILILVVTLTVIAFIGCGSIEALYQLNTPFCWTPLKIGIFGSLKSVLLQVFGFSALKILKRFTDDDSIAIVGSVSFLAAYMIEGLATSDIMLYSVTFVGSFGMLTVAMMRSLASRMAGPDRQGAAAASISLAETTCHLFSGILINSIYGVTVRKFRGAAFLVMSGLCAVATVLLVIFKIGSRKTRNKVFEERKQDSNEVISCTEKTTLL